MPRGMRRLQEHAVRVHESQVAHDCVLEARALQAERSKFTQVMLNVAGGFNMASWAPPPATTIPIVGQVITRIQQAGSKTADNRRVEAARAAYIAAQKRYDAMNCPPGLFERVRDADMANQDLAANKEDVSQRMSEIGIPISATQASKWASDSEMYGKFDELLGEEMFGLPLKPDATPQDAMFVYGVRDALKRGDVNEAHRLWGYVWPGDASDRYMRAPRE